MKERDYTLRYAIQMFIAISVFFILMDFLGLAHASELRVVNIVFIIYFTNRLAQNNVIEYDNIGYLKNLSSLFVANVINVILCVIGFVVFVKFIRPSYILELDKSFTWGSFDSLLEICVALFMEGMAGAAIVSFGLMQYWQNTKRVRRTLPPKGVLSEKL